MTKILLIRHGEAQKSPQSADPGLTEVGEQQARLLAQRLAGMTPVQLVSSPKARAQQTAQPLAQLWRQKVTVEQAVNEIPSPEGLPLESRGDWILGLLETSWDILDYSHQQWRKNIIDYLLSLRQDSIIFCHFMVINSAVAYVRNNNRIEQFRPDYTSMTELRLEDRVLTIQGLGRERLSRIV